MMSDVAHERFMEEALRLARLAQGRTRPNPMVGCVIVRDGHIVARGHHRRAGQPHAEVDALEHLTVDPSECTLYVNLEPCCTHGRTPPCTEAIIAAGIPRVVIGTVDTNPKVQGAGIRALRDAGVEVVVGVLDAPSRRLNAPYFKYIETRMPWVSAKYAMSLDGKIATHTKSSAWISNEASRRHVHELRNIYDAVMVGTGTLVADDPRLTCRIEGGRDPLRVVLDARLRAPDDARVWQPGTLLLTHDPAAERLAKIEARGVEIARLDVDEAGHFRPADVLRAIAAREMMSVLVEGGSHLLGSLFDAQLVDRVYAFVAPKIIGGQDAPSPVGGRGHATMDEVARAERVEITRFDDDVLIVADL